MPKILKDRFKNFHLNKFALLLALIHYFIVIFFEKDFFKEYSFNNSELTIAKLLVLISLWQILALMLKQYIISLQYRRYIHFSMIYFSISLLFLIFVWPGNWQYDDLDILDFVRNFRILPWQSYLMSYFYYIALFIFPSPVFVVILQITIISLIVGYIVYTLDFILNGSKIAWILYIPFILPPVIIQNYYPLRATIFSYLIIFLIVRINFLAWKNSQISIKEILIISIITSVIANIRGEGLIFLFFIPLIFFLGLRKYNRLNYNMIFLSSIIASFFIVSIPQYMSTSKYQRSLYSLTTVIQPVSYLLMKDVEFGHNEALNEISDVINTSYGYPNLIHVFWMNDLVKDSYQNDGNKLIFKTYKNLIKKYPKKFLEERFFNMTYQMYPYFFIKVGNRISIEDRHRIYKDVLKMTPLPKVNDSYMDNYYNLFFRGSISDYINIDLRSFVISKISFNNSFSDKIIFNYFIPLLLLIFLSYLSIQKRNVILFLSFASIWSLFFVVFLTAPESRFMYYFSVYLSCYVFSFYALAWCIFPLKKQV